MIARLIEACVRNRVLVLIIWLLVTAWGIYAAFNIPVDAIPDLSDVQVIIRTDFPEQAPQIVEDQVTYPLTTAMLAVPGAKVVRGFSQFGQSLVYVIFEDGTDIYWARSRVLEYLNYVRGKLPAAVNPALGPDATGVGWVFEYTLEDPTGKHDLAQLRSIQDWYLRYQLQTVPGVSEVASVGGFVKQYQVVVDPNQLAAYKIPLSKIKMAIQRSNQDTGGGLDRAGPNRVHGPGPGLHQEPGRRGKHRGGHRRQGHPGVGEGRGAGPPGPRTAAWSGRGQRPGRSGGRHCDHALWRKRPEGHRRRQTKIGRSQSPGCPRGCKSSRPMTAPTSSSGPSTP